ncbi:hypothetical protein LSM04_005472 [Trypanosoma melophagium]|uniref:uncharacterized protein n=1 Tax=Trypanosoma melophagium TaxID=715481 RepID=UPI00351A0092|nr:hypothetical protein LSM04_005472 [Trypanosoma melophagium]
MFTLLAGRVERDPNSRVVVQHHWPGSRHCDNKCHNEKKQEKEEVYEDDDDIVVVKMNNKCLDSTLIVGNTNTTITTHTSMNTTRCAAHTMGDPHSTPSMSIPVVNVCTTIPTSTVNHTAMKSKENHNPQVVSTTTTPHSLSMLFNGHLNIKNTRRRHRGAPNVIIHYGRRPSSCKPVYCGEGFTWNGPTIPQKQQQQQEDQLLLLSQSQQQQEEEKLSMMQQLIPMLSTATGRNPSSNNAGLSLELDGFTNASGVGVAGSPLKVFITPGSRSPSSNIEALASTGTWLNQTIGPVSLSSTEFTKKTTMMEEDSVKMGAVKKVGRTWSGSLFFKTCLLEQQMRVRECNGVNAMMKKYALSSPSSPSARPTTTTTTAAAALAITEKGKDETTCTCTHPLDIRKVVLTYPHHRVCCHVKTPLLHSVSPKKVENTTGVSDSRKYDQCQHWLHDGYHNDQEIFDELSVSMTSSLSSCGDKVGVNHHLVQKGVQKGDSTRDDMYIPKNVKTTTQHDSFYAGTNPIPLRDSKYHNVEQPFIYPVQIPTRECNAVLLSPYTTMCCPPISSHALTPGFNATYCGGYNTPTYNGYKEYYEYHMHPFSPYPHPTCQQYPYPYPYQQQQQCVNKMRTTRFPEVVPLTIHACEGRNTVCPTLTKFERVEAWLAEVEAAMKA